MRRVLAIVSDPDRDSDSDGCSENQGCDTLNLSLIPAFWSRMVSEVPERFCIEPRIHLLHRDSNVSVRSRRYLRRGFAGVAMSGVWLGPCFESLERKATVFGG